MFRVSAMLGALFLPAIVSAQPVEGPYLSGGIGANFAQTFQSSQDATRIYTNPGPIGLAALGWRFGDGLRAEVEGSDRADSISGIATRRQNGLMVPLADIGGSARTYAILANLVYDIPLRRLELPVRPYIGAGLGYGWLDLDSAEGDGFGAFRLPRGNIFTGPDLVTFGAAGAFAYQAMAGIAMPLHAVPGLELTAEYRFFGMSQAVIPVTRVTTTNDVVNGVLPSGMARNGFGLADNAVLIGMRYEFAMR